MNELIRVGIIGGAGYTAGELIRLLLNHPAAEIVFVNSACGIAEKCRVTGFVKKESNANKSVYTLHSLDWFCDLFNATEDCIFDTEEEAISARRRKSKPKKF